MAEHVPYHAMFLPIRHTISWRIIRQKMHETKKMPMPLKERFTANLTEYMTSRL